MDRQPTDRWGNDIWIDWSIRILLVTLLLPCVVHAERLSPRDWPQFRGHRATGVVNGRQLPVQWNLETGENVRWTAPIPGMGLGSVIAAGERLFLITAFNGKEEQSLRVGLYGDILPVQDESEYQWHLVCLSKRTGSVQWFRKLHEGMPAIKRHTKASHANTTPATDGFHVVAFLGSEGLHCYDIYGNLLWKKKFGVLDSGYYMLPGAQWGFGSSPIIYQNMVFIQCDVQKDSFVAAIDINTGSEVWRTKRDDVPTWSTPTIHAGSRTQLILNGYKHSGGYDLWTGEELWKIAGGGDIPVPTPVVANNLILLSSAHGSKRPLRAIHVDAVGEINPEEETADEHLAWNNPMDGVYMTTPIVYQDLLYACRNNGVLSCYEVDTGERVYRKRLGGAFTASPVAADGKLYFTDEDGTISIVRAGKTFELIAKHSVDEICLATPSITGDMLLVRTKTQLIALGKPAAERPRPTAPLMTMTDKPVVYPIEQLVSQPLAPFVECESSATCRTAACTAPVECGCRPGHDSRCRQFLRLFGRCRFR
jgi:outer membrane protein assembly factor BamB